VCLNFGPCDGRLIGCGASIVESDAASCSSSDILRVREDDDRATFAIEPLELPALPTDADIMIKEKFLLGSAMQLIFSSGMPPANG
jgi:hypothetical protein